MQFTGSKRYSANKLVEENNINVENIMGSGKDGRISKGDLINAMGNTPQPSKRKSTHGPEERGLQVALNLKTATP